MAGKGKKKSKCSNSMSRNVDGLDSRIWTGRINRLDSGDGTLYEVGCWAETESQVSQQRTDSDKNPQSIRFRRIAKSQVNKVGISKSQLA